MPQNTMVAQRVIDWEPLRKAYIDRPVRPTYEELSSEFGVNCATVGRCASDEGWVTLRAARLEQKAKECDALAVVIEAAQADRTVLREITEYALVSIRGIRESVESPEMQTYKPTTRLQCHNTANFALAQLAKALHDLGIVGMAKTMKGMAQESGGKWDPKILNQINLTVQQAKDGLEVKEVKAGKEKAVQEAESVTPTPAPSQSGAP